MSLKPVPPQSGFVPPPTFCKEWKVSLLTPMFGGGYEAGMIDPVHPIRPASVRGHLRIWWRATVGAAIAESKNLFEFDLDRSHEGEHHFAPHLRSPSY